MPGRMLALALLIAALAVTLAACGGDDEGGGAEATATATPAAGTAAEPGTTQTACEKVEAPEPRGEGDLDKPSLDIDQSKTYVATVQTSCGDFTIELDAERAPKTVASFINLAREDFYKGTTFHRVVPGFVIQGGDPKGDGTGGPGYSVREAPPSDLQYTRGVVAMAKAGNEPPGASGSQFFVVTGEDVGLPPDYALVGRVTQGLDVVDTIGTVMTDPSTEQPVDPVVIEDVSITAK